jgi:hypothetical protein
LPNTSAMVSEKPLMTCAQKDVSLNASTRSFSVPGPGSGTRQRCGENWQLQ